MNVPNLARRDLLGAALAVPIVLGNRTAAAQSANTIKIGVLTDENGPYADSGGPGSIVAAQMAAADIGWNVIGRPIEIVHADHQNKPDIAATIARTWYDRDNVDMITDLPVTAIGLAVQQVARERNKTVMITAAATSDFTAKSCSPTSTHWADDTHALTAGTARAMIESGGKTWFFITVDHAFGVALQTETTKVVDASGGKVLGAVRHPIGALDYASYLLAAQSSGAEVIGLASVGGDLINAIKQASEFGLGVRTGQQLATFLTYITDIHALGLPVTQGLTFASSYYWDQNDEARAFAKRFANARNGAMPTKNQAAIYAASSHFLKAVKGVGNTDPLAVNEAMRSMPVSYFGRPASVRSDGRVLFDLTLYRVKQPVQSDAPWDVYSRVRDIPQAEAFLPVNLAACAHA